MFYYNKGQRFKDASLIILIIVSVVFVFRLWYGLSVHNLFVFMPKDEETKNIKVNYNYIRPNQIFVYKGQESYVPIKMYGNDYETFNKIYSEAVRDIFNSKNNNINVRNYKKRYWHNLINQPAILINYYCPIDYKLFEQVFKININKSVSSIKQIIIIPDFVNGSVKFYIYDSVNNKIFSFKQYIAVSDLQDNYFDKKNTEFISSKNIYSRATSEVSSKVKEQIFVPANYKDIKLFNIKANNEFDISSKSDIEKLKKMYFDNPLVVRESTDKSKDKTFFDDERFLKLYKQGNIEYTCTGYANEKDSGIADAYKKAVKFINTHGGMPKNSYISMLSSERGGKYKIAFDYMIKGIPVMIADKKNNYHAIVVQLLDGNVVKYSRFVNITSSYGKAFNVKVDPINDALTEAAHELSRYESANELGDLGFAYNMKAKVKSGMVVPSWYVELNKKNFFISVTKPSSNE